MKVLALSVVMLAGCANGAAVSTGAKFVRLGQQSQSIERSVQSCIDHVNRWRDQQIAQASDRSSVNAARQLDLIDGLRDRMVANCRAVSDRKEDELSSGERSAYESQGQQEREHSSLMMIQTTSRMH
jgi:hypothetical protein